MTRKDVYRAVALLVAFALIFLLSSMCQASNWQAKTDAALDSAAVAQTRAKVNAALAASALQRANIETARRSAAEDRARQANDEADRLRAQRRVIVPVASQPGTAPTVSDSLVAVNAALENCEGETGALRRTITEKTAALASASVTEAELRGSLALERKSVIGLTKSVDDLTQRVESADPPCRVLFMNCPSRTTVFVGASVGSAILATVVTLSLTR